MDGDNVQYIFDTSTDTMYLMTYFYKDGTWDIYNNYNVGDIENIRLDEKKIQQFENILKEKVALPYIHKGFWSPMETVRDKSYLQTLWDEKKAPWKVWDK